MRTRLMTALALLTFGSLQIAAQSTAPAQALAGDALIRALLEEVRALRLSMQNTSVQQMRGQILIERIRLQMQSVRDLAREVEMVERSTRGADEEMFTRMAEDIERRLKEETDPDRRRNIERERDALVRRREYEQRNREESRQRMLRAESRLVEERDRLRQLEDEFSALTREMARP